MSTRQQTLSTILLVALAPATSTMTALRLPGVPVERGVPARVQ